MAALRAATVVLNLGVPERSSVAKWLQGAVRAWRMRWLQTQDAAV